MSFTDYAEAKVLNHLFGATTYTPSSTLYVALSNGTPTNDAGGGFSEPSGNAYARVSVANNKTTWTTASNGALENAINIEFPQATGPWGTIGYFGIYDAPTGGNLIGSGSLVLAKTIVSGDTPSFGSGALDITLD